MFSLPISDTDNPATVATKPRECRLYELPAVQLHSLQSVKNEAVRLIFGLHGADHLTDALIRWHRVPEHIHFKLAVLTCRALHYCDCAPPYLCIYFHPSPVCRDDVACDLLIVCNQ